MLSIQQLLDIDPTLKNLSDLELIEVRNALHRLELTPEEIKELGITIDMLADTVLDNYFDQL